MKRWTIFLTTVAVALYLGSLSAFGQHGPGGGHGAGAAGGHYNRSHTRTSTTQSGATGKNAAEHLQDNKKLASKLLSILQKQNPTMTSAQLQTAAMKFRSLGQLVAAVHVSENLGIPFDKLEAAMTGKPPMSLGRAISTLDPKADPKTELRKAHKQASNDLNESGTAS